jgi:hypothetical protein
VNDRSPPDKPDAPLGILFLCDPKYADLAEAQHRFERALEKAGRAGTLYLPEEITIQ